MLQRWRDTFDYAYANAPGGVLSLTVHPQTIGRAHALTGFERFIEHMASFSGVWFATLSQIYDTWSE